MEEIKTPASPEILSSPEGDIERVSFEAYSQELIEKGDHLMVEYGERDERVYHTIEHPRTISKRSEKIAGIFNMDSRERLLGEIAISWHDVIINFDPADPNNITAMIRRHRGAREGDQPSGASGNEGVSARAAILEMEKINEEAGTIIFTKEEMQKVFLAIEATYPDVEFNKKFTDYPYFNDIVAQNPSAGEVIKNLASVGTEKGSLFSQPHLEKMLENGEHVPPEVLIMVLDDLGGAGMATNEEFAREGDNEFQELSPNIKKQLNRLREGDAAEDEHDREKTALTMLSWIGTQSGFVAWQMLRMEKIFFLLQKNGQVDAEGAERLREAFGQFSTNVAFAHERAQRIKSEYEKIKISKGSKEAFSYLAGEMHFL